MKLFYVVAQLGCIVCKPLSESRYDPNDPFAWVPPPQPLDPFDLHDFDNDITNTVSQRAIDLGKNLSIRVCKQFNPTLGEEFGVRDH